MAKPPQSLDAHQGPPKLDADDGALVKLGTLKRALAWVISQIPIPAGGIHVRRSPQGDIWSAADGAGESTAPFHITAAGKVLPGLVGSVMPTLGGEPLDTTANVIDLTADGGNFYVWFEMTFTVTYLNEYLSGWTLNTVTVETGTSIPADNDHEKHLQFNTVFDGAVYDSYFSTSIPINLLDNGKNATRLRDL